MKKWFFLAILILTSEMACAKNVIETFYRGGFNNSGQIELYDDNTFMMKSTSISCVITEDNEIQISTHNIWGTYKINGQELLFNPEGQAIKNYADKSEQEYKGYIQDHDLPFFVFQYYIIEYNKAKFLFANKDLRYDIRDFRFDNHFLYIAQKLNETDGEAYPPIEFWRNEKDMKQQQVFRKDIKSIYPKQYQSFILDKPIIADVTNIREVSFLEPFMEENPDWKRYLITLNVGKKDGVKPEMIFFCTDKDKEKLSFRITSVFEKNCEGYFQEYPLNGKYLNAKSFSSRKPKENSADNSSK